jgi:hypothetical protein
VRIAFVRRESIADKISNYAHRLLDWVSGCRSFTLPNPDVEAGQDGCSSDDDDDDEETSAEAAETSSHREMRRIAIRDELLELRSLQERAHNMGRDSVEEESSV